MYSLLKLLCGIVVFLIVFLIILITTVLLFGSFPVLGIIIIVPGIAIALVIMVLSAIIAFVLKVVLAPFGYSIGVIDFVTAHSTTAMMIGFVIVGVLLVLVIIGAAIAITAKLFGVWKTE